MNISQIYAKFSPLTDRLYRKAMLLAARHRVLRCHHLLSAAVELINDKDPEIPADSKMYGFNDDPDWHADILVVLREHEMALKKGVTQDQEGCLDSPMTNSRAMRHVLELCSRQKNQSSIYPSLLILMTLACWSEEPVLGPTSKAYRNRIGKLFCSLHIEPLPAFAVTKQSGKATLEGDVNPTITKLENLIGQPVTADDLIDLYLQMKAETDPLRKAQLAERLEYLQKHG